MISKIIHFFMKWLLGIDVDRMIKRKKLIDDSRRETFKSKKNLEDHQKKANIKINHTIKQLKKLKKAINNIKYPKNEK